MVLGALVRLFAGAGQKPVSRWALVRTVSLPETTVDDRLRVLLARGDVVRRGERGQYRYAPAARRHVPDPVRPKEKPGPLRESCSQPPEPISYYSLRRGIDFPNDNP